MSPVHAALSVPFLAASLAASLAATAAAQNATFTPFGQGCVGTGGTEVARVAPGHAALVEGNSALSRPFSTNSRMLGIVGRSELPTAAFYDSLALRQDGGSGAPRLRVELEISMGFTASPPDLPNPTFAQNWSAPPTVVFDRKVLDLPDLASTRVPAPFDPRFDLDRPFLDGSSQNLAIDFKARNLSTILPLYVLDAVDAVGDTVGHLYANDPNATIGTGDDRGLVMFLHGWQAGGAAPSIGGTPPVLGGTYAVTLHRAAVGQTAILLTGLSDQRWLGFALPIDLTLFGAPGCRWYVSGELSFQDRVSSSGTAKQGIPIPQDPRLAGRPLFSQWAVLDLPANPAGVVWSDAARAVMGY